MKNASETKRKQKRIYAQNWSNEKIFLKLYWQLSSKIRKTNSQERNDCQRLFTLLHALACIGR